MQQQMTAAAAAADSHIYEKSFFFHFGVESERYFAIPVKCVKSPYGWLHSLPPSLSLCRTDSCTDRVGPSSHPSRIPFVPVLLLRVPIWSTEHSISQNKISASRQTKMYAPNERMCGRSSAIEHKFPPEISLIH